MSQQDRATLIAYRDTDPRLLRSTAGSAIATAAAASATDASSDERRADVSNRHEHGSISEISMLEDTRVERQAIRAIVMGSAHDRRRRASL